MVAPAYSLVIYRDRIKHRARFYVHDRTWAAYARVHTGGNRFRERCRVPFGILGEPQDGSLGLLRRCPAETVPLALAHARATLSTVPRFIHSSVSFLHSRPDTLRS